MIREVVTAAFALLLISSAATGTVAAGAVASADEATDAVDVQDTANESADDIYRYENGSAVLVYEGTSGSQDLSTGEFGADVSTGLADILVVSEIDESQEATGQFGVEITPDAISGDGNLTVDAPQSVEDLDATVSGRVTPEDSSAQMTLDMTAQAGAGSTAADSSGEVVVGADSFAIDADYSAEGGAATTGQEQSQVYRITELDNGYEVEFDEDRPINPMLRARWNTSEAAKQTLQQQYQGLAGQFGGSVEVTIDSYDYTEAGNGGESDRLDIEYTVTMNDIKDGVMQVLVQQIAASEEIDLGSAEQDELRQSLMDLTIEEMALARNQSESGMDGFVDAEITNYEDPFLVYLDAAASEDGPINQSDVDTLRQQLDARSAADLEQTVGWDVNVAPEQSQTTSVEAEVNYDTTNWDAYTDELADRDMPLETDVVFEGSAEKVDDQIEIEMNFSVTQEQLVDSAISELSDTAEQGGEDESAIEAFQSLENAEFKVAKADMMFNRDRVEVRAAAQFDSLGEFQNSLDQLPEGTTIRQVYGEGDGDGTTTYVYVEGLDMSDEELRETELADEDTTIHAPGEWDRSFPVMDVQSTADYLGVDVETNNPVAGGTGTDTSTDMPGDDTPTDMPGDDTATDMPGNDTPTDSEGFGPGFGAFAALLALLAGALLARRDE